jgi:hypothetical protein
MPFGVAQIRLIAQNGRFPFPTNCLEILEQFIIRGFTWLIVGPEDPEAEQLRTRLAVPASSQRMSDNSIVDSSLESLTSGRTGAPTKSVVFLDLATGRTTFLSSVEVINQGVFEDYRFLVTLDLPDALL